MDICNKVCYNRCPLGRGTDHVIGEGMAVTVLRLQRHGAKKKPFYHIVVTDSRSPRDGKCLERLGIYDPNGEPSLIRVNEERAQFWYQRGAQLSGAVESLLKSKKIKLSRTPNKNSQNEK